MKRITLLAAVCVGGIFLTACETTQQKPRKTTSTSTTTVVAPEVKPDTTTTNLPEDVKPVDPATPPVENEKVDTVAVPPPAPSGSLDYAIKVPGKPGFVRSPYTKDDKMIDVRGLPPGTEAQDPYTGRSFLVP